VVDHLSQFGIGNATLNLDGVPVFLVHVITGTDLLVSIAQFERQVRITFQIHSRWNFIE
jgi:hypothetical protein